MPTNYGTFSYPGNVASNPSVGPNSSTIPADSTLVGGVGPDGNLHPLAVDNSGKLELSVESIEIGTVDQGTPNTIGNAWPVKPTDGTNSQAYTASGEAKVDVTTTVLPPLAATSTKQSDGSQKTQIVDGSGNVIASTSNALDVAVTQPLPAGTNVIGHVIVDASSAVIGHVIVDSGTLTAVTALTDALPAGTNLLGKVGIDQTTPGTTNQVSAVQNGTWNINNISGTVSLPTGASTAANQTTLGSQTTKINDGTNTAAVKAASTAPVASDPALVVTMSPNAKPPATSGRSLANAPVVTTYGTPITSSAYTTIVASTAAAINLVEIFDSSGVALYFAVGAAASEVNQFVIYPGGNGQVPLSIPAGSRISYKAVSTSASGASAFNVLNMYS